MHLLMKSERALFISLFIRQTETSDIRCHITICKQSCILVWTNQSGISIILEMLIWRHLCMEEVNSDKIKTTLYDAASDYRNQTKYLLAMRNISLRLPNEVCYFTSWKKLLKPTCRLNRKVFLVSFFYCIHSNRLNVLILRLNIIFIF